MNTVELAVKMETDAITFYTEAAGKTKNPVGKKMFLTVAEDEKRHLEMVNRIIKGLDISYKEASPMKNVKTVFESLKNELMKKVVATSDELESFKIAMNMETEGIEFYKKAAGSVKTSPSPLEPEAFWAEVLSADRQRILEALAGLTADERGQVVEHLRRMAVDDGWQPEQRRRALAALAAAGDSHPA